MDYLFKTIEKPSLAGEAQLEHSPTQGKVAGLISDQG